MKTIVSLIAPTYLGIVIVDVGYGNNTSFLLELEKRQLKYLGGLAKNRKVTVNDKENIPQLIRIDELAQALPQKAFTEVKLNLDKPKTLWVATKEVEVSQLVGKRNITIVMNATTFSQATDIDYFITNVSSLIVTPQWIVNTYGSRDWVKVFYREAKGWLGLKEYQVRDKRSLIRHFILCFLCLYFYPLESTNGRLETQMGEQTFEGCVAKSGKVNNSNREDCSADL